MTVATGPAGIAASIGGGTWVAGEPGRTQRFRMDWGELWRES